MLSVSPCPMERKTERGKKTAVAIYDVTVGCRRGRTEGAETQGAADSGNATVDRKK